MRKEGKRLRECKYYALMLYGVFVLLLLGPAGIANGVMWLSQNFFLFYYGMIL